MAGCTITACVANLYRTIHHIRQRCPEDIGVHEERIRDLVAGRARAGHRPMPPVLGEASAVGCGHRSPG